MRRLSDGAERAREQGPHNATDAVDIPCLWFFLPLPHPLPLSDRAESERMLTPLELLSSARPTSGLASSLLLHQINSSTNSFFHDSADLWSAAVRAIEGVSHTVDVDRLLENEGIDTTPLTHSRTIAEVAVPGFSTGEEDILRALDVAIEHVRFVQRAVATATQRPVRLLARATLPPMVPTFAGVLRSPSHEDPGASTRGPQILQPIEYFIPNCAPPTALGIAPEPIDVEDSGQHRLALAADHVSRNGPFHTYSDLRREAMVQADFDGNERMAFLALGTAGEVLLDTALSHMLWEEQVPPEQAATFFEWRVGHTSRVRKYLPPRIGGSWDPEGNSPASRYLRDLVRLRHRVVHAGHEPTTTELEAARVALSDLEIYLGDLLAAGKTLASYPRTAIQWMGENGLRRRQRWTDYVQALVADPSEPNWIDTFVRWRHHLDRALNPAPVAPGNDPKSLMLYADKLENGTVRWFIHDVATAYAAIVDPSTVLEDHDVQQVTTLLAEVTTTHLADRRAGTVLRRAVPPNITWHPDHELLPELAIFPVATTHDGEPPNRG